MPIIIVKSIAAIEITIGVVTIIGVTCYELILHSQKSANVLVFVIGTAVVSATLGYNILKLKDWARKILIYFSGYIVLTKILIYTGLLSLNGQILIFIPSWIKDLTSTFYHLAIILILAHPASKKIFE